MSRQSAEVRLLAIAILNYADDEGYFYADEELIRGAIFPREESTSIRRTIDELSSIGYLELEHSETHGQIGRVVSFSEHQRVDRPKPSKIRSLWGPRTVDEHSTNNRRTIDGGKEGKGKEGKGVHRGGPPELDEVKTYAKTCPRPITEKCAEAFHDDREAAGWADRNGNPVRDWRASLRAYARHWNDLGGDNRGSGNNEPGGPQSSL